MKIKVPEKDVMRAISTYLDILVNTRKVVWWTRHNSGMIFTGKRAIKLGKKGDPDFVGILFDGRGFAIEAKGSDGKPTDEQTETLLAIRRSGAVGVLAYSVDDVERAFLE